MRPGQFGGYTHKPKPLTIANISKRLWELGISEMDVWDHYKDHSHSNTAEAFLCIWNRHLSNPTLDVDGILDKRKAA